MLGFLTKNTQLSHKRFSYQPRYYSSIKEDIKARKQHIRAQLRDGVETPSTMDHAYYYDYRKRQSQKTLRLFFIFIAFAVQLGVYFYVKSDKQWQNQSILEWSCVGGLFVLGILFTKTSRRRR